MAKRKNLYWTPYAAHCLDLILEDIGKIPQVNKTMERAIFLIGFIYSHTNTLNMMRGFTSKKELVRYGVTRFATSFLTLQRIHKQKHNLRNMFTSEKWTKSKWIKDTKGKRAADIVLMLSFWNHVVYILKVMGPLVRVLRLVDNERKPAMGYIYEAMDRAKEAIAKAFDHNGVHNENKYKKVHEIIDKRWDCQLHQPLHAAGHFLNPEYFYDDPSIENNEEVTTRLYNCIERLIADKKEQELILEQLALYKRAQGQFGGNLATRTRKTKAPGKDLIFVICK